MAGASHSKTLACPTCGITFHRTLLLQQQSNTIDLPTADIADTTVDKEFSGLWCQPMELSSTGHHFCTTTLSLQAASQDVPVSSFTSGFAYPTLSLGQHSVGQEPHSARSAP